MEKNGVNQIKKRLIQEMRAYETLLLMMDDEED